MKTQIRNAPSQELTFIYFSYFLLDTDMYMYIKEKKTTTRFLLQAQTLRAIESLKLKV